MIVNCEPRNALFGTAYPFPRRNDRCAGDSLCCVEWNEALRQSEIALSIWRIHRRIGMSGELFVRALAREIGHDLNDETVAKLQRDHEEAYLKRVGTITPLPGALALLTALTREVVLWAIATSGGRTSASSAMRELELPDDVPVITRNEVERAKSNPDLFLAAAKSLHADPQATFVVGDSLWDMLGARRAGALPIGLLSGGYGRSELVEGGAYRVYHDPADLLAHLDELGFRVGS